MMNFFEDILNQRPIKVTPLNGNFITLGVTLIALGVYNFDRPIKVTPSVTKVNIIVINK